MNCGQRTSQRLLVVGSRQRGGQLGLGEGSAQVDGVHRVGVARHDGQTLVVVAVGAQQRQDHVVRVRQNHIALQQRSAPGILSARTLHRVYPHPSGDCEPVSTNLLQILCGVQQRAAVHR